LVSLIKILNDKYVYLVKHILNPDYKCPLDNTNTSLQLMIDNYPSMNLAKKSEKEYLRYLEKIKAMEYNKRLWLEEFNIETQVPKILPKPSFERNKNTQKRATSKKRTHNEFKNGYNEPKSGSNKRMRPVISSY